MMVKNVCVQYKQYSAMYIRSFLNCLRAHFHTHMNECPSPQVHQDSVEGH